MSADLVAPAEAALLAGAPGHELGDCRPPPRADRTTRVRPRPRSPTTGSSACGPACRRRPRRRRRKVERASAAVGFARLRRRRRLARGRLGDAAATIASAAARPPAPRPPLFTSSTLLLIRRRAGIPRLRHCSTITTATGTEAPPPRRAGCVVLEEAGRLVLGLREPLLVALPCDVCCAAGLGASSASTPQPGFARASRPRIRCGDVDISRSASMVDSDASVACAIAPRVKFVDDWPRSAPQG